MARRIQFLCLPLPHHLPGTILTSKGRLKKLKFQDQSLLPRGLVLQLYGVVEHKVQGDGNCQDIGGCDIQKQEIREAVELPLTHHDLYKQIGIDPPRGVLLYGPPETGKTMLAKAVANHTAAAFVRVVGSEFVQKHLGEGPRMVRDVFRLAKENAPAIIFIDEVDTIATARFDAQTGASSL
ncbi:putative proteasome ATPase [Rosa chinensis]|uniref:Putative proteasome ATPase n=1 Tax=Rosa chinensis TaxID=74649 RepID=A0A2P6PJT7_ROSCH|nr:putative proteasome ATPase [Rosa chinensis]